MLLARSAFFLQKLTRNFSFCSLDEIATILDRLAPMKEKLGPLRAESMKHRQQKAAIENLSQTYNVPETVEKTFKLLEDSELLAAHAKYECFRIALTTLLLSA